MKTIILTLSLFILFCSPGCSKVKEEQTISHEENNSVSNMVEKIKSEIINYDDEPSNEDIKNAFKNIIAGDNYHNLASLGLSIGTYFCIYEQCPNAINGNSLGKNFDNLINDLQKVDEHCPYDIVDGKLFKKCIISFQFYMSEEQKTEVSTKLLNYGKKNQANDIIKRKNIYLFAYLSKNIENNSWDIVDLSTKD